MTHWIADIHHTFPQYVASASVARWHYWEDQCLWTVICDRISKQLYEAQGETSRETLVSLLRELWDVGAFATPYNKRTKCHQGHIKEYINL